MHNPPTNHSIVGGSVVLPMNQAIELDEIYEKLLAIDATVKTFEQVLLSKNSADQVDMVNWSGTAKCISALVSGVAERLENIGFGGNYKQSHRAEVRNG